MTISLSFECESPFDFDTQALICQVVEAGLQWEACPFPCQLEVLLTDDVSIQEINRESRGIDAPTDVLSFPAVDFPAPGDFEAIGEDRSLFHPENGELLLGDMVISLERVMAQAAAYGHSPRRELAFLTAHSLYHLLGYDHETEEERLVMEEKQEALLEKLGIRRDGT